MQGTLELELPAPRPRLRAVPAGPGTPAGPGGTAAAALPDARTFAAHIALTLVEVMCANRPLAHIVRVTSPGVYASVERRRRVPGTHHRSLHRGMRVRQVIGCSPAPGVYEAAVVLDDTRYARAMALRLQGRDGRWQVTELRFT